MDRFGLKQGVKRRLLPDGTVVSVSSLFGQNTIEIHPPALIRRAHQEQTDQPPSMRQAVHVGVDDRNFPLFSFHQSRFYVGNRLGGQWRDVGDIGFTPEEVIHVGKGVLVAVGKYDGIAVSSDHGRSWELILDGAEFAKNKYWHPDYYLSDAYKENLANNQFSPFVGIVRPGEFVIFSGFDDFSASTKIWRGYVDDGGESPEIRLQSETHTTCGVRCEFMPMFTRGGGPGMLGSPIVNIGNGELISFFSGVTNKRILRWFQNSQRIDGDRFFDKDRSGTASAIFIDPDGVETVVLTGRIDGLGYAHNVPLMFHYRHYYSGLNYIGVYNNTGNNSSVHLIDKNLMYHQMSMWFNRQDGEEILIPFGMDKTLFNNSVEPLSARINHEYKGNDGSTFICHYPPLGNPENHWEYMDYSGWGIFVATWETHWLAEKTDKQQDQIINPDRDDQPYSSWFMISKDNGLTWKSNSMAPFSFIVWATCLGSGCLIVYAFTFNPYSDSPDGPALWRTEDNGDTWTEVMKDTDGKLLQKKPDVDAEVWESVFSCVFPLTSKTELPPDYSDFDPESHDYANLFSIYPVSQYELALKLVDELAQKSGAIVMGRVIINQQVMTPAIWMLPGKSLVTFDQGMTWTERENPFLSVGRPVALGSIVFNQERPQELHGNAIIGVSADVESGKVSEGDPGGPGFFLSLDLGKTWFRNGDMEAVSNVIHVEPGIDLGLQELYR